MTISVTVRTATHGARVLRFNRPADGSEGAWETITDLDPHTEQQFAAHSTADICVQELLEPEEQTAVATHPSQQFPDKINGG